MFHYHLARRYINNLWFRYNGKYMTPTSLPE